MQENVFPGKLYSGRLCDFAKYVMGTAENNRRLRIFVVSGRNWDGSGKSVPNQFTSPTIRDTLETFLPPESSVDPKR